MTSKWLPYSIYSKETSAVKKLEVGVALALTTESRNENQVK